MAMFLVVDPLKLAQYLVLLGFHMKNLGNYKVSIT